MGLLDFIKGKTRRTIKKHYKKGDKVKLISFFVKENGRMHCLDLEDMAVRFRKRELRCTDIIISVFTIEVIEESYINEEESNYIAKLEGDEVMDMRYFNMFSYLTDIKKAWYWYPSLLDGHYIDYNYVLGCLKLDNRIPKKLINEVRSR